MRWWFSCHWEDLKGKKEKKKKKKRGEESVRIKIKIWTLVLDEEEDSIAFKTMALDECLGERKWQKGKGFCIRKSALFACIVFLTISGWSGKPKSGRRVFSTFSTCFSYVSQGQLKIVIRPERNRMRISTKTGARPVAVCLEEFPT